MKKTAENQKQQEKQNPAIPAEKNRSDKVRRQDKKHPILKDEEKILSDLSPFYVKEAYKALRTNMIFSLPAKQDKVILISSAGVAEGKTTSCLNIGITFAEAGIKVCVVDCDLRRPNVGRLLRTKGRPGLSNYLARMNSLDEVIRHSKYENLDIIFAGDIPPNPAELLASDEMEELLKELGQRYDYVFVDTPPVNVVTDASLIASKTSGVLLVVNQQRTNKSDFAKAIAQLEFVKAKVLGALYNGAKAEFVGGGYKYKYKYKYGYRYRYKRKGYYYYHTYGDTDDNVSGEENHG